MTESASRSGNRWLAQADLLILLARVFSRPVSDRSVFNVPPESLGELIQLVGIDGAAPGAAALLQTIREAQVQDIEIWKQEHTRLFDGSGVSPMNETVFVRRDKGAILADIAGFYRAFGQEAAIPGEKMDYLVTELEFTALLLILMAEARRAGNEAGFETAQEAFHAFVADHLGEWAVPFSERVLASTPLSLYRNAAAALAWTVEFLAEDHGIPWSPSSGTPLPVEVDGSSFTCGAIAGEGGAARK